MHENFKELVSRLKIAHGGELVSIIVYGSAVELPEHKRKDDFHVLVITSHLNAEQLHDARPVSKWWVKLGYSLPIYFTKDEFLGSLDVFAIEFRHMKRAYQLLFGEDLLATVEPSAANLRLQCEYEMRGKLLRLRTLYLPSSETAEDLTRLMSDSVYSFVQYCRPVLELKGIAPPLDRHAAVNSLGREFGINVEALLTVLDLRDGNEILTDTTAHHLFEDYLGCLNEIAAVINKM